MTGRQEVSGEEALARGAIRAGVRVAAGYPGSPGTGVLDHLLAAARTYGIAVEWAVNEKVAFELCWGAAIGGARALFATKSIGLNVALDTLMTVNLVGTRAGLVLLVGDDPGSYRSQNEEDSRHLATLAELPLWEPTRIADAAPMIEEAFAFSEEIGLPVLVRIVRSLAFTREAIDLPPLPDRPVGFTPADLLADRPTRRWIASTTNVVPRHAALHRTLDGLADRFATSPWNRTDEGDGDVGVIAAGFCATKVRAVLDDLGLDGVPCLALGTLHPLPERPIREFLASCARVLVVEEIDPYVETLVKAIAQEAGIRTEIIGKRTGALPREGELLAAELAAGLTAFLGVPMLEPAPLRRFTSPPLASRPKIPLVGEGFCEGCPYEPTFRALERVLVEDGRPGVLLADPGCAVRLMIPPFEMLDVKMSMGSCVGIGIGIARTNPDVHVIACPGDSGFYHSALLGLVDAAYHRVGMIVLLLDNRTTALSGCQPSPTTGLTAMGERVPPLWPEAFARACGIDFVRVFDPADFDATIEVFRAALAEEGLRFLVMRSPCILLDEAEFPSS